MSRSKASRGFPPTSLPRCGWRSTPARVADPTGRHIGSAFLRCVGLCHGAEPWQILMSHATEALLEGEPSDVALNDLGERTLESFDRPAHVFEVL